MLLPPPPSIFDPVCDLRDAPEVHIYDAVLNSVWLLCQKLSQDTLYIEHRSDVVLLWTEVILVTVAPEKLTLNWRHRQADTGFIG